METKINNSQKNRYKFVFGDKHLTLTTDKDNLFMEEIERVATEKYEAIKEKLPNADNETIAILMAINALSVQLSREIDIEKMEDELNKLRSKTISDIKEKVSED
ncbi:TPA: cell division protein ZapA [Streptococcus agalactiae]